ncbi:helix-turn-helix domain-containing protein [Frigidibacter albus]|uniref:Helix-turn-helix domain-containing protein n=1 Tax=Frigidibacter albus TaxID=1465486 RepID=A0A6L8VBQ6_9RHOB|nr:IclR family transcriptional regulator [Frigidibacter albus]MZQ87693.1 helix-turn-helix domain-containing protein [Frigidibacter albus]NBE29599.1 helix-turn-helix domain-containing protein [Frigidibacter albus]GGH43899.1 IclR family transcriptional regulator [Frigidibacter albus]
MDKAFVKGLRLVETLALSDLPRGVSDLAAELEMTKSNVHRLLQTLQAHGYVRQVPANSTYELTTKIWELGSHVIRRMDLIKIARPAMTRLAEQTGETVHLSVLEDIDVIYLDKIESAHHIRANTSVGSRAPAFTVATGKAMLSHMPDDYLDRFTPHLRSYTETTRTTLAELREDVAQARAQGHALVLHGEWREGIAACACAILGRSGELVGAIGISGPDSRLKRKQLKLIAPQVMEAAEAISVALGYSRR